MNIKVGMRIAIKNKTYLVLDINTEEEMASLLDEENGLEILEPMWPWGKLYEVKVI